LETGPSGLVAPLLHFPEVLGKHFREVFLGCTILFNPGGSLKATPGVLFGKITFRVLLRVVCLVFVI